MTRGCLALLLHAHLPFVRHPEQEQCVEERWLFDAITECYLPLLGVFRRLLEEGVPYRLTLSLSPTLLAMLGDRLLRERYLDHLGRQGEVARREAARCSPEPARAALADRHARRCAEAERSFREDHGCDLMGSFRGLEQAGVLELATTAATHGYLPLLRHLPGAVSAQLRVSAELFPGGAPPGSRGLWLPECGYFPGLEGAVADAGFGYFLVDSHGIPDPASTGGAVSRNGIRCANGVAVLGRDPGCARRVWDARAGYPGHPSYREYHRDLGREAAPEVVRGLFPDSHAGAPLGIKLYRVTGPGERKDLYRPERAACQARAHAEDFVQRLYRRCASTGRGQRPRLFVAPYDAELFGHWWFEGPRWLEEVLRLLGRDRLVEAVSVGDYLTRYDDLPAGQPVASSWGDEGYNAVWMDRANRWVFPHLAQACGQMRDLVEAAGSRGGDVLTGRALRQAGRSLLLAQASDWAFMLRMGTAADYAERRVRGQLSRFRFLADGLRAGRVDEHKLRVLETLDNLFPDLEYRFFAGR